MSRELYFIAFPTFAYNPPAKLKNQTSLNEGVEQRNSDRLQSRYCSFDWCKKSEFMSLLCVELMDEYFLTMLSSSERLLSVISPQHATKLKLATSLLDPSTSILTDHVGVCGDSNSLYQRYTSVPCVIARTVRGDGDVTVFFCKRGSLQIFQYNLHSHFGQFFFRHTGIQSK